MNTFNMFLYEQGLVVLVGWVPLILAVAVVFLVSAWPALKRGRGFAELEINEAELGIGTNRLKLRPSYEDVQFAHRLWVEVSTRKLGLPIDLEHDVIAEVYNSWYEFFGVTRDLIKDIPANRIRGSESTEQLVHVAMEVLNEGLRPHLTTWQARFRRWYERALDHDDAKDLAPQEVQKRFPAYADLAVDLLEVNQKLIRYRSTLKRIALGK